MSNNKKSLKSLFEGELRLVDINRQNNTARLYIENMVNDHILAIVVSVPLEVLDQYNLTIS